MEQLFKEYPYEDLKGSSSGSSWRGDQEMGDANNSETSDMAVEEDPSVTADVCFSRETSARYLILARMVIAEMFGMFIMMFSVFGVIASTKTKKGEVGLLEYALTGGFAIIVIVFSIGPISGAHVNPSVTIAFATIGQFPWSKVPLYISAQMVAAVTAAYIGTLVYSMPADFATTRAVGGCKSAFFAELFASSFIMFLASAVSSNNQIGLLACFAIGAGISLAIMITGPVSGGSMNPARSFGPAVISGRFDDIWLYLLAPTIGAILGALLFRLIQTQHQHQPSTPSLDASQPSS